MSMRKSVADGRLILGRLLLAGVLMLVAAAAPATTLHVAVAANFEATMKQLAADYEARGGADIVISSGSTGKLYAQILNGAPFDVFFAADARRPRLLESRHASVEGSRFTYAIGKLALWYPQSRGKVDGRILKEGDFRRLAIANPKTAPYGAAAVQTLKNMGIYASLQDRMVRGQNIGQTFQFVASGNADLGFVALSQLKNPAYKAKGSYWLVPQSLYQPLEQQAVIVSGHQIALAEKFLDYVRSPQASAVIRRFGYEVPDE